MIKFLFCLVFLTTVSALPQVSFPRAATGQYMVRFKNTSSLIGLKPGSPINASVSVRRVFARSRMLHVSITSEAARKALHDSPDVEFVEPDYLLSINPVDVKAAGAAVLRAPAYSQSFSKVQVTEAWSLQKCAFDGPKTIVAVIDSGLDRGHPLFRDSGSIWENETEKNGVAGKDDDGNGLIDDINGWNFVSDSGDVADDNDHGTHVAGIVLGVGQDVFAAVKAESKIKIMTIKYLDKTGTGSTSDAVNSIMYAVDQGARVINCSWGNPIYTKSLAEAYRYAYNKGVVMISAAGNSSINNDVTPMYPASLDYANNISVAATDDSDNRASFSNYGRSAVSVGAPGVAIESSVPGDCGETGCFKAMSGTSMATPFIAGLAALIIREAPQLSADQVKNIILGSVDLVPALTESILSGGRVNVYNAIDMAIENPDAFSRGPAYISSQTGASSDDGLLGAGCGLVKAGGGGGGPGSGPMLFALFLLPLALALKLRSRPVPVRVRARRR